MSPTAPSAENHRNLPGDAPGKYREDTAIAGKNKGEYDMRYVKINSVTPARRIDGLATAIVDMEFASSRERDALLSRAGLPEGSEVVPRLVFRLRTDRGIQALSLSLDGRGVHGKVDPYGKVSGEVLHAVREAFAEFTEKLRGMRPGAAGSITE